MGLKVRNTITSKRLAFIATLVFIEAFLIPINAILQQGVWPEPVQLVQCVTTAILQVTTLSLGLLERT